MSFLGDLNRTFNLFKWILRGNENYRRSSLIQGDLEIPVEVIFEMDDTQRNRAIMERYRRLVTTHYKDPEQDGLYKECIGGNVRR